MASPAQISVRQGSWAAILTNRTGLGQLSIKDVIEDTLEFRGCHRIGPPGNAPDQTLREHGQNLQPYDGLNLDVNDLVVLFISWPIDGLNQDVNDLAGYFTTI